MASFCNPTFKSCGRWNNSLVFNTKRLRVCGFDTAQKMGALFGSIPNRFMDLFAPVPGTEWKRYKTRPRIKRYDAWIITVDTDDCHSVHSCHAICARAHLSTRFVWNESKHCNFLMRKTNSIELISIVWRWPINPWKDVGCHLRVVRSATILSCLRNVMELLFSAFGNKMDLYFAVIASPCMVLPSRCGALSMSTCYSSNGASYIVRQTVLWVFLLNTPSWFSARLDVS